MTYLGANLSLIKFHSEPVTQLPPIFYKEKLSEAFFRSLKIGMQYYDEKL